jgi:small subunit ribosomal protein S4e
MMHIKRYTMPGFWPLEKKANKFVVTPVPGPHPKRFGIPLRIVLRDVLGFAETASEAKQILNSGGVMIDKAVVRDEKRPVGLMDVLEFPAAKKQFRVVADEKGLALAKAEAKDAGSKLCRINGKNALKGGNFQLTLHDGRSIMVGKEKKYKPGDSVLIELPAQKILKHYEMKAGAPAMVVSGKNIGASGKIKEITPKKSMTGKSRVVISAKDGDIETLREYVLVGEVK